MTSDSGPERKFWQIALADLERQLGAGRNGLSSAEAAARGTKQRQLNFLWHLAGNARSPDADRIHARQWIEMIACRDRARSGVSSPPRFTLR